MQKHTNRCTFCSFSFFSRVAAGIWLHLLAHLLAIKGNLLETISRSRSSPAAEKGTQHIYSYRGLSFHWPEQTTLSPVIFHCQTLTGHTLNNLPSTFSVNQVYFVYFYNTCFLLDIYRLTYIDLIWPRCICHTWSNSSDWSDSFLCLCTFWLVHWAIKVV